MIRLVMFLVAMPALVACQLPPPDGCTPGTRRCSPSGIPETCSSTQRWSHPAQAQPCSAYGANITCCRALSPYAGHVVEACAPANLCLAPPDASSDAADAAEGG